MRLAHEFGLWDQPGVTVAAPAPAGDADLQLVDDAHYVRAVEAISRWAEHPDARDGLRVKGRIVIPLTRQPTCHLARGRGSSEFEGVLTPRSARSACRGLLEADRRRLRRRWPHFSAGLCR
jgi:hypothetical protein